MTVLDRKVCINGVEVEGLCVARWGDGNWALLVRISDWVLVVRVVDLVGLLLVGTRFL